MRILFHIESLTSGGKQRRLLELIHYLMLTTDYEMNLVLTEDNIHYEYVHNWNIPITIIERKGTKRDPRLFYLFYKICKQFKPDIIHSWGVMTTFYSIPSKLICGIPLISSMIADAEKRFRKISLSSFYFNTNCYFSDIILSNSKAGLIAYNIQSPKAKVIYNGVKLDRFQEVYNKEEIKKSLKVNTAFLIAMVAAFTDRKDYDLFLEIAKKIEQKRKDVTFIGIGDGSDWARIQHRVKEENIKNVFLIGKQQRVEQFIAASDLGILCTFSEGISNSIMEYMALGKAVIVTDMTGGSIEIVEDEETGYCIDRDADKVVQLINVLLDNKGLRNSMGKKGKERIKNYFSIEKMGSEFIKLYSSLDKKDND